MIIGSVTAVAGLLSSVVGGWLFVDQRFEQRLNAQLERGELKQHIVAVSVNAEQQQIQMRLDVMEDREEREREKSQPDRMKIERWRKQMQRLEKRYDRLDQKRLQME